MILKLLITILLNINYQAPNLLNYLMSKKSEYILAKLFNIENSKKNGKKNDFCLKKLGTLEIY